MNITYDSIKSILDEILKNKGNETLVLDGDLFNLEGGIIEYSSILRYIKELDPESRTVLNVACKKTKDILKEDSGVEVLLKILEYVSLEVPRVNEYEELKKNLDSFARITRQQRRQSISYDKKIEEAKNKLEKVQGDFISILSIFSAVIIAFFGGINLLSGALTSINYTNKYKLITIIIIIGIIMFNVIYLLLYNISKIIKSPITINLELKPCSNCKEYGGFKCLINRYPIPVYYNILSVLTIIIVSVMYYFDKYNVLTNTLNLTMNNSYWIVIIYIVCIIIVALGMFLGIKKIHKNNKCKKEIKNIDKIDFNKIFVESLLNEKGKID